MCAWEIARRVPSGEQLEGVGQKHANAVSYVRVPLGRRANLGRVIELAVLLWQGTVTARVKVKVRVKVKAKVKMNVMLEEVAKLSCRPWRPAAALKRPSAALLP